MKVIFYNNISNHNVVNKKLELINEVEFNLKDDTDIINPTLFLKKYKDGNYCYIPDLNRYYFIDNITLMKGGYYGIYCSIDVLKTYSDEINKSEYYSKDGVLKIMDSEIDFDNILNSDRFLILIGG